MALQLRGAFAHSLHDGDVVVLVADGSGNPYVASAAGPEDAPTYNLVQVANTLTEVLAWPEAHLTVVWESQGEFLGLRSNAVGGLLLQTRKRFPHELCFFNNRLGVYEQWMAEPLRILTQPRSQATPIIVLTSRQVPVVRLQVRAFRLNCGPGSPLPPRNIASPVPMPMPVARLSTQLREGVTAAAAASPLASPSTRPSPAGSVFAFPTASAASSPSVAAWCVASGLEDDAMDLSRHIVHGFVVRVTKWPMFLTFRLWRTRARHRLAQRGAADGLRGEVLRARALLALRAHVEHRQHKQGLMRTAGVHDLRRRQGLLRRALRRWGEEAAARRERWHHATGVYYASREVGLLRSSLRGWRAHACEAHDARAHALRMWQRWGQRCLADAFEHWSSLVAQSGALVALLQRRRRGRSQAAAFRAWLSLVHALSDARALASVRGDARIPVLQLALLRGAFDAWRSYSGYKAHLKLLEATAVEGSAQRVLMLAFGGWWAESDRSRGACEAAESLGKHRDLQAMARAFAAWRGALEASALHWHAAEVLARRVNIGLVRAAFTAWAGLVLPLDLGLASASYGVVPGLGRQHEEVAGPSHHHHAATAATYPLAPLPAWRAARTLRCAFRSWQQHCTRSRRLRWAAGQVARRCDRTLLRVVLREWLGLVEQAHAAALELLVRYKLLLARQALRAWRHAAIIRVHLRRVSSALASRSGSIWLRATFAGWRKSVSHARTQARQADALYAHMLLARALHAWRLAAEASRGLLASMQRLSQRPLKRLVKGALREWALRAHLRAVASAAFARLLGTSFRGAFLRWHWHAQRSSRLRGCGALVRRLRARRALAGAFIAWQDAAVLSARLDAAVVLLQAHLLAGSSGGAGAFADAVASGLDAGVSSNALAALASASASAGASGSGRDGSPSRLGRMAGIGGSVFASPRKPGASVKQQQSGLGLGVGLGGVSGADVLASLSASGISLRGLLAAAMQPRRAATHALRAWHLAATQQVQARAKAARAIGRHTHNLLGASFAAWRGAVTALKAARVAAEALWERAHFNGAVGVLRAWAGLVARLGSLRHTCRVLLQARVSRTKLQVLRLLGQHARASGAAKSKVAHARAAAAARRLGDAWTAWGWAVEDKRTARDQAEALLRRHSQALARRVFLAWGLAVTAVQEKVAVFGRLLMGRRLRGLLQGAFFGWQAAVMEERRRREAFPMLCRVFYAWRTLAQPDTNRALRSVHHKHQQREVKQRYAASITASEALGSPSETSLSPTSTSTARLSHRDAEASARHHRSHHDHHHHHRSHQHHDHPHLPAPLLPQGHGLPASSAASFHSGSQSRSSPGFLSPAFVSPPVTGSRALQDVATATEPHALPHHMHMQGQHQGPARVVIEVKAPGQMGQPRKVGVPVTSPGRRRPQVLLQAAQPRQGPQQLLQGQAHPSVVHHHHHIHAEESLQAALGSGGRERERPQPQQPAAGTEDGAAVAANAAGRVVDALLNGGVCSTDVSPERLQQQQQQQQQQGGQQGRDGAAGSTSTGAADAGGNRDLFALYQQNLRKIATSDEMQRLQALEEQSWSALTSPKRLHAPHGPSHGSQQAGSGGYGDFEASAAAVQLGRSRRQSAQAAMMAGPALRVSAPSAGADAPPPVAAPAAGPGAASRAAAGVIRVQPMEGVVRPRAASSGGAAWDGAGAGAHSHSSILAGLDRSQGGGAGAAGPAGRGAAGAGAGDRQQYQPPAPKQDRQDQQQQQQQQHYILNERQEAMLAELERQIRDKEAEAEVARAAAASRQPWQVHAAGAPASTSVSAAPSALPSGRSSASAYPSARPVPSSAVGGSVHAHAAARKRRSSETSSDDMHPLDDQGRWGSGAGDYAAHINVGNIGGQRQRRGSGAGPAAGVGLGGVHRHESLLFGEASAASVGGASEFGANLPLYLDPMDMPPEAFFKMAKIAQSKERVAAARSEHAVGAAMVAALGGAPVHAHGAAGTPRGSVPASAWTWA